ncbi:hypothetical protein PsB1_1336 [Candidatus Phycosocius spiralis]|uniref:BrnT family toxin n=1 Tax=Candidatus Phycosocius spiralis TaxID=2815099 RepID=A0ABQ4PW15_9PROT|nr:hypothetical protein PsB1_1336 [Candidatus Phycosocius spiralis]
MLYAALIFEGPILTKIDNRKDYGEVRWIAIGKVELDYFTLIYTIRDGKYRLITAWRSGRREREHYERSNTG